jgi:alginate O-acetyltransferase complex protein AlgI
LLFNTFVFLAFFFIVYFPFLGFGFLGKRFSWGAKAQNLWLLSASYFFYGWWEWFFLSLIFASTAIDFIASNKIESAEKPSQKKTFSSHFDYWQLGASIHSKVF